MLGLRPAAVAAALLVGLSGLAACSGGDAGARPAPARSVPVSQTESAPTVTSRATPAATSGSDSLSLPGLMDETFTPSRIEQVEELSRNAAFIRSKVTYTSGDLTISGMLLRPRGEGPFPGVVLNHGYIDPETYINGQGLRREQDKLARAGFVVLHTDYRGHASSDDFTDPFDQASRVGYTRDSINAVLALKQESYVDPDRIAMFGKSMGGAVTLNALVVQPGLVKAAVIFSSMSSDFIDNIEHFGSAKAVKQFYAAFGLPELSPDFYAQLSPRTYFDRITEPVLLHHGRADRVCPYGWSVTTQRLLSEAGVDSELLSWTGEDHAFDAAWEESMDRSITFLREYL